MLDERLQFIEECKSQEWSMAEVCRRFEISRITGYKWRKRYEEEGLEGLKDRSHAPHHNPRQVTEAVEEAVVEARAAHPYWGAGEAANLAATQGAEDPMASGEHSGRNPAAARNGGAAEEALQGAAQQRAFAGGEWTESDLVRRFQGLVSMFGRQPL